jgi:hypothetical protein
MRRYRAKKKRQEKEARCYALKPKRIAIIDAVEIRPIAIADISEISGGLRDDTIEVLSVSPTPSGRAGRPRSRRHARF